jgi:hypothetical protein
MAKFAAMPREGHLSHVVQCFGYIKNHLKSRILIDTRAKDWTSQNWVSKDWSKFYPDLSREIVPSDAPEALGVPVQINMFCDASHATDLITRRSTTGILFFLNGTPINWYSRRQNTIESSTVGSEFLALRIALEMNDTLQYKLRMFGIQMQLTWHVSVTCQDRFQSEIRSTICSFSFRPANCFSGHKLELQNDGDNKGLV